MPRYIIEGGVPLQGNVNISGSKNTVLKLMAASLLTNNEMIVENVPNINDVKNMEKILEALGTEIEHLDEHTLKIQTKEIKSSIIPTDLSCLSRAGIITMGPLLNRVGEFTLTKPGGCRIGFRPIDRHVQALKTFGAEINQENDTYQGFAKKLVGGTIQFPKNTVMGTEQAILTAVLAQGETIILNAAKEPDVDDLISCLKQMGALIKRDETDPRKIIVQGVEKLEGTRFNLAPDRNETVTFAIMAAITRGRVNIKNVRQKDLTSFLAKYEKIGAKYEFIDSELRCWLDKDDELIPIDIETSPHPGFMTDWQQPFSLLLTQANGQSLVHETIYENRFQYAKELNRMGAKIEILQPKTLGIKFDSDDYDFDWDNPDNEPYSYIRITGPTKLRGTRLRIPDLRAGATLVLAALAASGKSEILGIENIDRGYENFDEKLKNLGARVKKIE